MKRIKISFAFAALMFAALAPSMAFSQTQTTAGAAVAPAEKSEPVAPELTIPNAPAPSLPSKALSDNINGESSAAADASNGYGMSWKQAWTYGGFIMWVLLGVSIIMFSLVIYLLCTLRQKSVAPRRLMADVRNFLVEGDQNSARSLCEDNSCPFSSVVLSALDCLRATESGEDRQLLRDVVESEGARQAEAMQSQTQLLLDLSAIAPMLGLLGTTLGMLKAFGAVAQDVMVSVKPVILAQGVSQAIITTIFGLIIAIPCMGFYAFFRRRTSRMVGLLEMSSAEIITALAVRRSE